VLSAGGRCRALLEGDGCRQEHAFSRGALSGVRSAQQVIGTRTALGGAGRHRSEALDPSLGIRMGRYRTGVRCHLQRMTNESQG